MIEMFRHRYGGANFVAVYKPITQSLKDLQSFHKRWTAPGINIITFDHTDKTSYCTEWSFECAIEKNIIFEPFCSQLNIDRFFVYNDLGARYPNAKFLWSLITNNYDAVKDSIRNRIEFDYHIAYVLAATLNHVAIIELLIDTFPINPLCCDSLAISLAITKKYSGMINTLMFHNRSIISKDITEIDGIYDVAKWKNMIIRKIGDICCCQKYDESNYEILQILFTELHLTFDANVIFKEMVDILMICRRSKFGVQSIFESCDQLFCSNPLWPTTLYEILCNTVRECNQDSFESVEYLLQIERISGLLDKHRLLKLSYDSHNYGDRQLMIQKILEHNGFSWNIAAELECDQKYARTNYDRFSCTNYTRNFLRAHHIDPAFNGYDLLKHSLKDFNIETVKYCLQNKTSQAINFWLATSDIYLKIFRNLSESNMEQAILMTQTLLDDGRAKPYIDNNEFLTKLIENGHIELIEVLIKSGQIFFPLCMTRIKSFHPSIVMLFAENEIYFEQIISCKNAADSPFINEIIKVRG